MNSDLPAESGGLDPGVDQLFRTLTAGPETGELAGEQAALAMFRENVRPAAAAAKARGRSYRRSARSLRSAGRLARGPFGWGIRLTAAAVLALGGGMTAAAYAAVLPAPVQHFAHELFHVVGVPDMQHGHPASRSHHTGPARHRHGSPGHRAPAPPRSVPPSPRASATASPSASPSRPATVPAQLTASAASGEITAGSQAVINGRLTRSGKGVAGVTVTLLERRARQTSWQAVGTAQTNARGNVAVGVSVLTTNADFELTGPDSTSSAIVTITVSPPIAAELNLGARAVRDVLVVSTQYARRGNVVVLQVESSSGSWVYLRAAVLNANGKVRFVLNGKRLQNKVLRAVLLGTPRHAASVSNSVTVPPPS
jgi:hypothetical protein